jgi:hypothetical protein
MRGPTLTLMMIDTSSAPVMFLAEPGHSDYLDRMVALETKLISSSSRA